MASLFTTVIGSRTEGNASSTNGTNASTDSGDDHSAHTLTKTILFLFLAFAIGGIKVVESLHYAVHTVQCQMQLVNYCSVMNF